MHKKLSRRSVIVGTAATAAVLPTFGVRADAPKVHEVAIRAFKFEPETVQVRLGDTIRWTNFDIAPHTATADQFGWDTQELVQGATGEVRVTEGMETSYFCAFHPHMVASIDII